MDTIVLVINILVVTFMVSTMFGAGLGTTVEAITGVFSNVPMLLLVLIANLVAIPALGWGLAEALNLGLAGYVAIVLTAASPGAPFGAKMAMIQRGDVVTGATLQAVLAAAGSVTFPVTVNFILERADLGTDISLDVMDLFKTVAILQIIPFVIGLVMRYWTPETALDWLPTATRISSLTLLVVIVGMLLGSWEMIIDLIGSRTILASLLLAAGMFIIGTLLSTGAIETKTTMGSVAMFRNAGPIIAAVAIGFDNDPEILGAVVTVMLGAFVIGLPVSSYLAKDRPPPDSAGGIDAPVDVSTA